MRFDERTVDLKDGRRCVLKVSDPDDAQALIDYLKIVSGETDFLGRYKDEVTFTEEKERELLQYKLDSDRDIMMSAYVDGEIAGNCSVGGKGGQRRFRHRCGFAIAIKKKFWHLGIGTAMMKYSMELAEKMGYEQAELEVVEGNVNAKALYEKAGFQVTGKSLRALKYDDGSYRDEYIMIKVF